LVLWHLGYPDQSVKRSHEALALAQGLSHPFSLAYALISGAFLHQYRREEQSCLERAEAIIAVCSGQGFSFYVGQGTILRGWALAEQGQAEEGIEQIRHGLATYQAVGAGMLQSYYLVLLAEAYGKAGHAEEGLATLAEALTMVDTSGERFYEAELYRLKGALVLQSGVRGPESENSTPQSPTPNPQSEAEAYFLKAIEVARHQSAKSLELRAVMSLSRLGQQQGKKEEARRTLSEIYGWFTEGFDTKDLHEAKALLEELSH